jgi:hypothetical protein
MTKIDGKNVGRIAERIVANELEARGFRVSDLNSDDTAANADLIAVSNNITLQVQVKGAANPNGPWWVGYGSCTPEIIDDRNLPMFNRHNSFYRAHLVVLVAVRSPSEYSCVVLPEVIAEQAAQMALDRDYRVPTNKGQPKQPHKVWIQLSPRPRRSKRYGQWKVERKLLTRYRDERGWARLLTEGRGLGA